MAQVDPGDDSIQRLIARHYRYDAARHERRHVVVAAFDNEQEFLACINRVNLEIRRRRERGEPVEPSEHASGVVYEPGYLGSAANGHLLRRAMQHRVATLPFDELELPRNMAVARFVRSESPPEHNPDTMS